MNTFTKITKGAGTSNEVTRTITNCEDASGTGLQGYVKTSYQDLVQMFGPSNGPSGDGKVTNGWSLKIDGVIVTIYDYKEDLNTGKDEEWHIGGKGKLALELAESVIL